MSLILKKYYKNWISNYDKNKSQNILIDEIYYNLNDRNH